MLGSADAAFVGPDHKAGPESVHGFELEAATELEYEFGAGAGAERVPLWSPQRRLVVPSCEPGPLRLVSETPAAWT